MSVALSNQTLILFALYAGVVISFIVSHSRLNLLQALLSVVLLVALGWTLNAINTGSLLFIGLLFTNAALLSNKSQLPSHLQTILGISFLALCLLFALHKIPGFHNSLIFHSARFGHSGLPFLLYANFDKALAALAILICFKDQLKWAISHTDTWQILISLGLFFGVAWYLGAKPDFKFGELTLAFIFFNLFVTCLAEEAFFRLMIQHKLAQYFSPRFSAKLAPLFTVILTALLFMLVHFHTGGDAIKRLGLIFLAGLLYALVYQRSKSLGSAIGLHFSVNLIHFTFFTYPATFSN